MPDTSRRNVLTAGGLTLWWDEAAGYTLYEGEGKDRKHWALEKCVVSFDRGSIVLAGTTKDGEVVSFGSGDPPAPLRLLPLRP